jgi:hypothetical protein
MPSILLSAAAAAMIAAAPAPSSDAGESRLMFLPGFDGEALQMLECAETMRTQPARFEVLGKAISDKLQQDYRAAGRSAVVRAALMAPGSPASPKVKNISFESKEATLLVTNDLRVHEDKARFLVGETRRSGFDTSSTCLDASLRKEAAELNSWFAEDTSVLTDVH